MPPATAKVPFASEVDGLMIQPPPVTKSLPLQLTPPGGGQVISACADETTTSAVPETLMWSARTVISPARELVCSLMMMLIPPGNTTVWLGCPLTAIVWPLTTRPTISELPLADGAPEAQTAVARAIKRSALMVFPPAVKFTLATDASERLRSP